MHVHLHCPSSDVAHQIFDAVLAEVRLLESRLQAAKQAYARPSTNKTDTWFSVKLPDHLQHRWSPFFTGSMPRLYASMPKSVRSSLTSLLSFCLTSPFGFLVGPTMSSIADHDKVWLHSVDDIETPAPRVQSKPLVICVLCLRLFMNNGRKDGVAMMRTPFSHWTQLLDFAKRVIRPNFVPTLRSIALCCGLRSVVRRSGLLLALTESVGKISFKLILPLCRALSMPTVVLNKMEHGLHNSWLAKFTPLPKMRQRKLLVTTVRSPSLASLIVPGVVPNLGSAAICRQLG